jgi:hypothetical protein
MSAREDLALPPQVRNHGESRWSLPYVVVIRYGERFDADWDSSVRSAAGSRMLT